MAKLLLENGADVNAVSSDGRSSLDYALFSGCGLAVVELLLEYGAMINATDTLGYTHRGLPPRRVRR
jgi:ankyrin repeat protein